MLARYHGFSRGLGHEDMRGHVFEEMVLGFWRKQMCLGFVIHNENKIEL